MTLFVQAASLIEGAPPPELACNGLGRIEFVGGGLGCFVLYRNAISLGMNVLERQICGRIFAPLEAVPEAVDLMIGALIESGMAQAVHLARRRLLM
jgi:hypothetical protein